MAGDSKNINLSHFDSGSCSLGLWYLTLAAYIESDPPVIVVHNSCRTKFTDPGQFDNRATDVVDTCGKKLWSSGNTFTWKDQCFFCASNAVRGVGPVHSSDIRITTEFADAL